MTDKTANIVLRFFFDDMYGNSNGFFNKLTFYSNSSIYKMFGKIFSGCDISVWILLFRRSKMKIVEIIIKIVKWVIYAKHLYWED